LTPYEELFSLAARLKSQASNADAEEIKKPLASLEEAAKTVGRSFSGSWWGYHSKVYYANLVPPPPGAHFSQEWGLMDSISMGSTGDWREFEPEALKTHIRRAAGDPNLELAKAAEAQATEVFEGAKSEIVSILQSELDERPDTFLESLKKEVDELSTLTTHQVAKRLAPTGQVMTRDTVVLGQGMQVPAHMSILSEVAAIRHTFSSCKAAASIAQKAASHLERKSKRRRSEERIGTNVFIGHGQSRVWRDLKDFLQDRLSLPWDEFNRVPVAGTTNISRLSEMLDAAAIAFLVMTAEDEMSDGAMRARVNVVHEAGLFQGRLGFSKAVIMLEEGCEQFSNIEGLGQIRFPRGSISAVFEEVRKVLEREGLISGGP
jgi:predicted nucleotide-binding protein